jgi:hypothetical protein
LRCASVLRHADERRVVVGGEGGAQNTGGEK